MSRDVEWRWGLIDGVGMGREMLSSLFHNSSRETAAKTDRSQSFRRWDAGPPAPITSASVPHGG